RKIRSFMPEAHAQTVRLWGTASAKRGHDLLAQQSERSPCLFPRHQTTIREHQISGTNLLQQRDLFDDAARRADQGFARLTARRRRVGRAGQGRGWFWELEVWRIPAFPHPSDVAAGLLELREKFCQGLVIGLGEVSLVPYP